MQGNINISSHSKKKKKKRGGVRAKTKDRSTPHNRLSYHYETDIDSNCTFYFSYDGSLKLEFLKRNTKDFALLPCLLPWVFLE